MPQEIEIKQRLDDPDALHRRLHDGQARRDARIFEVNRILDTPDRRLLAADCGLRLRLGRPLDGPGPATATLTFKGPRRPGTPKMREELETPVADDALMTEILRRLGFAPVILYEKRRETWLFAGCRICLDELPRIGWFVEIEGPDAAAIDAVRRRLGLAENPLLAETYVELAAEHGVAGGGDCIRLAFAG